MTRVISAVVWLLPVFPPETDIVSAGRHVSKVPEGDIIAPL